MPNSQRALALALRSLWSLTPFLVGSALAAQTTVLMGGTLIDGNGAAPVANSIVIAEGSRIARVGRVGQFPIPQGATVINTTGMTVMPGLFESHAHLMLVGHGSYAHWDSVYPRRQAKEIMPAAAKQALMHGITSVRDLGGPLDELMEVKRRIDAGELVGATVYTSGPFIQKAPYPGTEAFRWGVNGAADARAKVNRLADAGVCCIKLIDQDEMTMEELHAVVDEAHKRRLPVIAHAHRPEEIRRGLAAGVDDFEHTGMAWAPEYPPDVIAALRERTAQGNKPPLYWTPTIDVLTNFNERRNAPSYVNNPEWYRWLADDIAADVKRSIQRLDTLAYYRMVPNRRPTLERKFAQLRESGVRLLIGTDAGVPANFHGYATPQEMVTWVRVYKMDPMETIRAATFWPALSLGVLDKVGTIEAGKIADIIAVPGNPLLDMTAMTRVAVVIKDGKRVK